MTAEPIQHVETWLRDNLGWGAAEFVSALSGGNSNLTWRFREGDRACVVRTPPANDISPTSARGIQREAQILTAIADYPVRAPQVLGWCDDETPTLQIGARRIDWVRIWLISWRHCIRCQSICLH